MDQNMDNAPPTPEATAGPESAEIGSSTVSKESQNMALLCHLLGLLTSFVGPLILWLIKKEEDPYVEHHGREALNFQIMLIIANFIGGILTLVCIGFLVLVAVWIVDIIFSIMACIAASKGQMYKYPVSLRLIK